MDELEITKDLIRALALFGIVKQWDIEMLNAEYERYGISEDLVCETLS